MLKKLLSEKKCFKLVCGAGNEDAIEVEKLVALYAKAGCHFFDISANKKILDAAKKGLDFSISKEKQKDFYFCISVGTQGDPHVSKASIDEKKCISCGNCQSGCPRNAIYEGISAYQVIKEKCIGCAKCAPLCPVKAINFTSENKDLKEVLPPLVKNKIDCIELHAPIEDEDEVFQKWNDIQKCFDGILSICIDRSKIGNQKILERVKKLIETRKPFTTIIQADGSPMSGSEDDFKTTLQAVAMAEIFQEANLEAFLLLSGGTNSKTTELAKQCGISPHGVAIGSYARKIVEKYVVCEDFLTNEKIFDEALEKAKNLVETSLKYLDKISLQ